MRLPDPPSKLLAPMHQETHRILMTGQTEIPVPHSSLSAIVSGSDELEFGTLFGCIKQGPSMYCMCSTLQALLIQVSGSQSVVHTMSPWVLTSGARRTGQAVCEVRARRRFSRLRLPLWGVTWYAHIYTGMTGLEEAFGPCS